MGAGGHQGYDRRRGTLVHIGSPDLEGRGRYFKAEADQNHGHGESGKARDWTVGKSCGYLGNVGCSGGAKGEGDAVEEEGGGKGAQQEIFEPGFGALPGALANGGQDVGGNGRNFEADEDQQQLRGAGHEAHAHGAK